MVAQATATLSLRQGHEQAILSLQCCICQYTSGIAPRAYMHVQQLISRVGASGHWRHKAFYSGTVWSIAMYRVLADSFFMIWGMAQYFQRNKFAIFHLRCRMHAGP